MANKLTIVSLGGRNINDGVTYRAKFLAADQTGDTFVGREVIAEVLGEFPEYVRSQPEGRVLPVAIDLVSRTWANLKQLRSWVNPRQGELELRVTDEGGNTLRVWAKPVSLRSREGTDWLWELLLWVSRPIWENVTQTSVAQTITSSGQTWVVNNPGSDAVRPVVTIVPNAYKSATAAPGKMRHVVVANRSPLPLADARGNPYPIELTNGGWDVETKIRNGELHPQGYDLSVYVNGVRVPRYLSNWGAGIGDTSAPNARNITSSQGREAIRFRLPGCTTTELNTVDEVAFVLKKVGNPVGTIAFELRQDAAGTPGTLIATTASYDVAGLTTSNQIIYLTIASPPALSPHTWYWAVVSGAGLTTVDASNYVAVAMGTGPYEGQRDPIKESSNGGSTWSQPAAVLGRHLCFRVFTAGTARIWAPLLLPGGLQATLATDFHISDGTISLTESVDHFPERGCVLVENEAVIYSARSGRTLTVAKRGARGTATAYHRQGASVYLVDADVRVVFGHADFSGLLKPQDFEPLDLAPVIHGGSSTNAYFVWQGPFVSPGSPSRPMAWVAEYEEQDSQGNPIPQASGVSLSMAPSTDDDVLVWKDAAAEGSYVKRNAIRQQFPTGIAQLGDAITLDPYAIPDSLRIEHLLTNEWGEENVVNTHRKADQGNNRTVAPSDEAYVYRIRVVRDLIVEVPAPSSPLDVALSNNSASETAQTFTLEQPATITGLALYLRKAAGLSANKQFQIIATDSSGVPVDTQALSEAVSVSDSDLLTGYQWVYKAFTTPISLPAGVYAIHAIAGTETNVRWARWSSSVYAAGARWQESTNVYSRQNDDLAFRLLGSSEATTTAETGQQLNLDHIRIKLDSVTPRTPAVLFQSSDVNVYVLDDAVLENTTTGQKVTLRALLQTGDSLQLDFETLQVTNSDDDLSRPEHAVAVVQMDEGDPFRLDPGSNTLKWTDPGVSSTTVTTAFFARYL